MDTACKIAPLPPKEISDKTFPLQHTLGHHKCPACEKLRAELICSISSDLEFSVAANRWVESRSIRALPGAISARYIRENTEESYRQYIRTLELFFTGHRLGDIHMGHFSAYQRARLQGDEPFIRKRRPQDKEAKSSPVKPKKVNQELGLLQHIMKRADCWTGEMDEIYQPILDDDEEVPRALSPEEQRHWLDVSRLQKRWELVHKYSMFAFGTSMSTDEIRGVRLGDINTFQRVVVVKRKTAKVRARARTIELIGADLLWAVDGLLEIAKDKGAVDPQHYLFPWGGPGGHHYKPEQSMSESGIKVAWNEVRAASGLTWFRTYDCRHTANTRLAEAGVPIAVIKSRAGHISDRMSEHYTHISQSSQRQWMEHAQSFTRLPPESKVYSFQKSRRA